MRRTSFFVVASLCVASSGTTADPTPGSAPPGVSQSWLDAVQRDLKAREYRFSATDDGAFSAPNRAQDLRSRVAAAGVQVISRTKGEQAFELGLRLARMGRDGSLAEVPEGVAALSETRVEIRREGLPLVEWYTNDEHGLEQGWTISARPAQGDATSRQLVLELATAGLLRPIRRSQDDRIVFVDGTGAGRLFYSELAAHDANGALLDSALAVADGRVQIRVSDEGAAYPVSIDPVIQPASWSVVGNEVDGYLGSSVETAGDVNGDGYSDVIVGAPGELLNAGRAYLFLGGPGGLAVTPTWTGEGGVASDSYGASVAAAGHVNGDVYGDVVIGAPTANGGAGYIVIYQGSASGQLVNPVTLPATSCFSTVDPNSGFGVSVATAGDVDGDGFDDVIAGESGLRNGANRTGGVCIFRGSSNGILADSKWLLSPQISRSPVNDTDIVTSSYFGNSVSTAGDVNGDGFADVIVGAPLSTTLASSEAGAAYVFLGSASGPQVPAVWVQTGDLHSGFGGSVANAGDLNGDGFADVLVGAPNDNAYGTGVGAAFIFHGAPSPAGIEVPPTACAPSTVPAQFCTFGKTEFSFFGGSVATAGDLNGDGYADAVFGAPLWSNTLGGTGAVELLYGRANGAYLIASSEEIMTTKGSELGGSVATAGDTDGDGFSEVLAGAIFYLSGADSGVGQASLYRGSANPPQTSTFWNFAPGNAARAGDSIATADLNGDGRSDIVIGAPGFDNGFTDQGAVFVFDTPQSVGPAAPNPSPANANRSYFGSAAGAHLGQSVASAGDINNDGFEDLIVGAPGISHAYLFTGGPGGLPVLASQDLVGPNAGTRFGQSVTGAGDVNGDGLADVVIGAPLDETSGALADEGVARLYLGSAGSGLVASAWSAHSGQAGAQLGGVVSGVGDVNRDGWSDVLVSAPFFSGSSGPFPPTTRGLVELFTGSPAGLSPAPTWTVSGGGSVTTHNQLGGDLGYLGDIDADGFSDLWIRSTAFSGLSQTNSIQVYRGQASAVPVFAISFTGLTAAGGDISGDGLMDLIVADSGAATVSAFAGPLSSPTPIWTMTGPAGTEFGARVATGDVNGDGTSDVLIGSPGYDGGFTDAGLVSLYLGNLVNYDDGVEVRPSQMDGACLHCAVRRVSLLGRPTTSPQGFYLSAVAHSPAGPASMRLQWEVRSLGTVLDGTGIATGTPFAFSGSPALTNSVALSLGSATPQHWRLRLTSGNPFFPHSRWFSLAGNGPNESDLRGTVDQDGDGLIDTADNCPVTANAGQADADSDGVGDVCDNCVNVSNPRVTPDALTYLSANAWATLTGGQRDDDHDGYGNKCDAHFPGVPGLIVGVGDLTQFRASNGKSRIGDNCGTTGTRPCAIFDLDEASALLGAPDLALFRTLNGKAPGSKCSSCPLLCQAGTAGTCGPIP